MFVISENSEHKLKKSQLNETPHIPFIHAYQKLVKKLTFLRYPFWELPQGGFQAADAVCFLRRGYKLKGGYIWQKKHFV